MVKSARVRKSLSVQESAIKKLKSATTARIALGHAGESLPTDALLSFQFDHARARDAVHSKLNAEGLSEVLGHLKLLPLFLESRAQSREEYLRNPQAGRRLSQRSVVEIQKNECDAKILIVISDGLSAKAVEKNGPALIAEIFQLLGSDELSRVVPIVQNGRVAIADEIASMFGAAMVIHIIGERPGLSTAENLSVYLTYRPVLGTTDEARNCISNIGGAGGLSVLDSAKRAAYLVRRALEEKQSGLSLKDEYELVPRLTGTRKLKTQNR